MIGRRALVVVAVAALVDLVGGVAAAASVRSDAFTNQVPSGRLRLAILSQFIGGARLGLLLLLAAAAVVLLAERGEEIGTALSTAAFAIAGVYTALPLAGAANALAGFGGGSAGQRVGAALSVLTALPLSALACWLTAPRNLQRSR